MRGYEVRAVPLHFISATEMEKLLKPYARTNAIVNVDASRNLLVLEVEGRVSKLMAKADSLGNLPDAPVGTPDDFTELVDVQFEMMALAFQTGQTRVASMRMTRPKQKPADITPIHGISG